jgi:DNA-directed RNA polymerase specialized sigma24 family protein
LPVPRGDIATTTRIAAAETTWGGDLRRSQRREAVQVLLDRAQAAELPSEQVALLRAAYADGRSAIEIAALVSAASIDPTHAADAPRDPTIPRVSATPRAIRRRLRRLSRRVMSPQFIFVLRHRDTWPPSRRRVATACVLHGLSLRQAAASLRLSLYTVRRHHDAIGALFESVTRTPIRQSA